MLFTNDAVGVIAKDDSTVDPEVAKTVSSVPDVDTSLSVSVANVI